MLDIEQIGREYEAAKREQAQHGNEIDAAFFWGWLIGVGVTSAAWLLAIHLNIISIARG